MRRFIAWLFGWKPMDNYQYLVAKIEEETVGLKVHVNVQIKSSGSLSMRDRVRMLRDAADELEKHVEEMGAAG